MRLNGVAHHTSHLSYSFYVAQGGTISTNISLIPIALMAIGCHSTMTSKASIPP
jgi:hypothetical protein